MRLSKKALLLLPLSFFACHAFGAAPQTDINASLESIMETLDVFIESVEGKGKIALSPEEDKRFEWFNTTNRTNPGTMGALAPEDRKVWDDAIRYTVDTGDEDKNLANKRAFVRSRVNYINLMLERAEQAELATPYDAESLQLAVMKRRVLVELGQLRLKSETDAKMVAYEMLTPAEQKTWLPEAYKTNPEAAVAVCPKWSKLVVDLMVESKLLSEATAEGLAKKQAELFDFQKKRFEATYAYQKQGSAAHANQH